MNGQALLSSVRISEETLTTCFAGIQICFTPDLFWFTHMVMHPPQTVRMGYWSALLVSRVRNPTKAEKGISVAYINRRSTSELASDTAGSRSRG